jgi:hypothetical protein
MPLGGELKAASISARDVIPSVELFEEAIDEGERAICENAQNPEIAVFLAQTHEAKKSARRK